MAQSLLIGELAKYGVLAAIPLSDNLPFDIIAISGSKLYRIQVKASTEFRNGAIIFGLTTSNFYDGTTTKYSKQDVDMIACVNLVNNDIYIIEDYENKSSISIRVDEPKRQRSNVNWAKDVVLNQNNVNNIFGPNNLSLLQYAASQSRRLVSTKQFNHICMNCKKDFQNGHKKAKFCSPKCSSECQRKVQRPEKSELEKEVNQFSWRALGRKYGVTDNTIRKWVKHYELV